MITRTVSSSDRGKEQLALQGCERNAMPSALRTDFDVFSFLHDALSADWRWAMLKPYLTRDSEFVVQLAASLRDLEAAGLPIVRPLPGVAESLATQACEVALRVLTLEMHVTFMEGGRTQSGTSESRFNQYFQSLCRQNVWRAVAARYPELDRLLADTVRRYMRHVDEIVRRLTSDLPELQRHGLIPESITLVDIEPHLGDLHDGNRAVGVVRFSDGEAVIYKPRSLDVDVLWTELVGELNCRGLTCPLRTANTLSRDSYGWAELIDGRPCNGQRELADYYRRIGYLVALLHITGGSDFHHENLIAVGDQPILVDLETVFQPLRNISRSSSQFIYGLDSRTVLSSGLLPQPIVSAKGVTDVSGLGGDGTGYSSDKYVIYRHLGTDKMYVDRTHVPIPRRDNQPFVEERNASMAYHAHRDDIEQGFLEAYDILMEDRAAFRDILCSAESTVDPYVRCVLRATKYYAQLRTESYHPDVLQDAADRRSLLRHVWKGSKEAEWVGRVASYEHEALSERDIPKFTARFSSTKLETASGDSISDVLAESAFGAALRRLEDLGPKDRLLQHWALSASLTSATQRDGTWRRSIDSFALPTTDADTRKAVEQIGDRLLQLSVVDDAGRRGWLSQNPVATGVMVPGAAGLGLYAGSAGIGLFLGYAAHAFGTDRFEKAARDVVSTVYDWLTEAGVTEIASVDGGFGLSGGITYLLAHMAALWQDERAVDEATRLAIRASETLRDDCLFDVVSGTAGTLLTFISLHKVSPTAALRKAIADAAEHLICSATKVASGLAWETPDRATQPLTGFSHGASGIGYALVQAGVLLNDSTVCEAGIAALEYERGCYSAEHQNWPDFRDDSDVLHGASTDEPEMGMRTWCHGAPGIGLARLKVAEVLGDDTPEWVRDDLGAAVATTGSSGAGGGLCLCHGALGNLEFLIEAAEYLDSEDSRRALNRYHREVARFCDLEGLRCTSVNAINSPGLMTGLAGVGYALLRQRFGVRIPSVLVLQPPTSEGIDEHDS